MTEWVVLLMEVMMTPLELGTRLSGHAVNNQLPMSSERRPAVSLSLATVLACAGMTHSSRPA